MTSEKFTVLEQLLLSKTGEMDHCEDAVKVNDNFAAVIDGATSKSDQRWNCKTSGHTAAAVLRKAIDGLPADCGAHEAVRLLTDAIAEVYQYYGNTANVKNDPKQRITASIAIFSPIAREIWIVGDCQAIIGEELFCNTKLIDDIFAATRAAVLEIAMAEGASQSDMLDTDQGRKFIFPLLQRQTILQNNPSVGKLWYPVIDGFPVPERGVRILKIPEHIDNIVIATDGYPLLKNSLADSEAELQRLIKQDPLMFRLVKATKGVYPGNLSFDDRAYLKLKI